MSNLQLKTIKMVALDIDGVLLEDTFSPVICHMVENVWGGEYTKEIERNVFSQKREIGGTFLMEKFNLFNRYKTWKELFSEGYFPARDEYLKRTDVPKGKVKGFEEFLKTVKKLGLKLVSYGGLEKDHFFTSLTEHEQSYFDDEKYICTNDFRPGVEEIIKHFYNYDYKEVLFIDDIARVGEVAKAKGVPFIGIPSHFRKSFQREAMIEIGVKHIYNSINDVKEEILRLIDDEANTGTLWSGKK